MGKAEAEDFFSRQALFVLIYPFLKIQSKKFRENPLSDKVSAFNLEI